MSTKARLVFLAIAVVIAIPLVMTALISDESESDSETTTTTNTVATATATAPATPATVATVPQKPAAPKPPLLKAGGEKTITVTKGDTVRFRVVNPAAEEVHVHGYDVTYDLEPGVTKTISFPAKIEGQFEIELEQSATPLAKLVVNPR